MYEKNFKKDWDDLKDMLEKEEIKKPALVKSFGPFKKRMASGIGAAMATLDKIDPVDLTQLTPKTKADYESAVKDFETAVNKEQKAITDELEPYLKPDKGGKDKNEIKEKDKAYRGLKVFQAKLDDYVKQAQARLVEMENALDKKSSEGEKMVKAFKSKCTASLSHVVAGIKKVKLAPSAASYNAEIAPPVGSLVLICSDGSTIDGWEDRWSSNWGELRRQLSPFKVELSHQKPEEVLEHVAKLSEVVKTIAKNLA